MRSAPLLLLAAACGHVATQQPSPDGPPPDGPVQGDSIYDPVYPPDVAPSCVPIGLCSTGEYCCASVAIPGGGFARAFDVARDRLSGDASSTAEVSPFRLDRFEVNVARFRAFVAAGGGTQQHPPPPGYGAHERIPGTGWNSAWDAQLQPDTPSLVAAIGAQCPDLPPTWTDAPTAADNRPINCLTWYEANAFCLWDGGRLPTSAEWNFAAVGGSDQRAYPWSDPPGSLGIDEFHAAYGCRAQPDGDCTIADISPVGAHPSGTGRWGQVDLGGNVAEWVYDAAGAYPNTCRDCIALPPAGAVNPSREIHGGSWGSTEQELRASWRFTGREAQRSATWGVRCARRAGVLTP